MKEIEKKNGGITLVALVITIILLLILAGISIASLTGSGLFENARLAEQKSKNAQELEDQTLTDYENKIAEYIDGSRNSQIEALLRRVEALEAKTTPKTLWTGSQSSGTITLNNNESIYNYSYLIFSLNDDSISAIVAIDKSGMTKISSGTNGTHYASDGVEVYGFYISSISADGKQLTLERSGCDYGNSEWICTLPIVKIEGLL